MNFINLFAKNSTVSIQVMKVDGRKVTASMIAQFVYYWPFDPYCNFIGDEIYGFAKLKMTDGWHEIVIAKYNGKLVKFSASRLKDIAKLNDNSSWSELLRILNLKEIFEDENVRMRKSVKGYDSEDEQMINFMDASEKQKIFEIRERVRLLLKELADHHIII